MESAQQVELERQTDQSIVHQTLKPILFKDAYPLDNAILQRSQETKKPIIMTLRTGQVFTGYVRWYTPHEIGLKLGNGGKVYLFRHAIYEVKAAQGG
jgi:sRNA-binding regulator protein Hfq